MATSAGRDNLVPKVQACVCLPCATLLFEPLCKFFLGGGDGEWRGLANATDRNQYAAMSSGSGDRGAVLGHGPVFGFESVWKLMSLLSHRWQRNK